VKIRFNFLLCSKWQQTRGHALNIRCIMRSDGSVSLHTQASVIRSYNNQSHHVPYDSCLAAAAAAAVCYHGDISRGCWACIVTLSTRWTSWVRPATIDSYIIS